MHEEDLSTQAIIFPDGQNQTGPYDEWTSLGRISSEENDNFVVVFLKSFCCVKHWID